MTLDRFNEVTDEFIKHSLAVLSEKGMDYSRYDGDRLAHFRGAAKLLDNRPKTALFFMLSKPLTSLNDYCRFNNQNVSKWKEKIMDSVNYLFLLWALVVEEGTVIDNE